nr:hypothetical protein [Tanacetum cinerariifolium]
MKTCQQKQNTLAAGMTIPNNCSYYCQLEVNVAEYTLTTVPKQPLGMNLAALWLQQSFVLLQIKSSTSQERIERLEGRVDKLEEENMVLKDLHNVHSKVNTSVPVLEKEKSFKQVRIIADIDEDVKINMEKDQAKLYRIDLKTFRKVTIARATTTVEATKVSVLRRRKGVVIQDPKETTSTVIAHSEIDQDEAFVRQLEAELNADLNWNAVMEQVKRSERLDDAVMKYQALKRNPLTKAQARKNMIIYLKNMACFKLNYFKGMTYSEIRPLFEKYYNYNQAFLEEVNEEVTVPEKEVKV